MVFRFRIDADCGNNFFFNRTQLYSIVELEDGSISFEVALLSKQQPHWLFLISIRHFWRKTFTLK